MNRRRWLGVLLLIGGVVTGLALLAPSLGGYGLLETPGVTTHVFVTSPPRTPAPATKPPTTTTAKIPCPGNQPGKVIYFADDPAAARYHDFGTPLVSNLSPLYEPTTTPRPDTHTLIEVSWYRLCHDPALARNVTAAAYPRWPGLHGTFHWLAALRLLARGHWSSATVAYYITAPTPSTMEMISTAKSGPPLTFIVRAPFNGWYLVVRFGTHDVLLRPGCGDQPVLNLHGYQAPLTSLYHRA